VGQRPDANKSVWRRPRPVSSLAQRARSLRQCYGYGLNQYGTLFLALAMEQVTQERNQAREFKFAIDIMLDDIKSEVVEAAESPNRNRHQ
jgi:hypothetical protein